LQILPPPSTKLQTDSLVSNPDRPDARIEAVSPTMERVRRQIHTDPELSNEEFATTELLQTELRAGGISSISAIGATGVVAEVDGDPHGPIVALRADIDALPIQERTDLPFKSRRDGVMHACGHDAHTAMLLGAMLAAAAMERLPGSIRGIFQPAEEAEPLGARRVVDGGHVAGVRGAIALHVDPTTPTGTISLRDGEMMAASDTFEITIHGRHAHAGWPQDGVDAIAAAAAFVQQAQTVVSRRIDPRASTVINFGSISGGAANNIVCDEVVITGVIRTLDEAIRPQLRQMLDDVLVGVCSPLGASAELALHEGEPVLRNDPLLAGAIRRAGERVAGVDVLELAQPTMNGEDFAFYGEHIPTAMAWIGCRNESLGYTYPLHHPMFAVDEGVLMKGAAVLLETALDVLANADSAFSLE